MKVVNIFKQPYDIYIGRKNIDLGLEESIWANPFKINNENSRDVVLENYRKHIISNNLLYNKLEELEDKKIGCYCKPKNRCHGDILKQLLEEKKDNIKYYINLFSNVFGEVEYDTYQNSCYIIKGKEIISDSGKYGILDTYKKLIDLTFKHGCSIDTEQENPFTYILCPIDNPITRRNLNLKNLMDLI